LSNVRSLIIGTNPEPVGKLPNYARRLASTESLSNNSWMGGVAWVLERSFWIGPMLLLVFGCLIKYLQNQDRHPKLENLFFGTELGLTSLGSILGAFVNFSGTVDASRVLTLVVISSNGYFDTANCHNFT
jgi:hypothetical protein